MIALILLILASIWLLWTATVFIRVLMNLARALGCLVRMAAMVALLIVQAGATGLAWAIRPARRPVPAGNVVRLADFRKEGKAI